MKRFYLSGLAILISMCVVGCANSNDSANIDFEDYRYEDSEDMKTMREVIKVSVSSNEISAYTVKQILEKLGSNTIDTDIQVENIQGNVIATLSESGDKVDININKESKSRDKLNVILTNVDTFKEASREKKRELEEDLLLPIINLMETFESVSDVFSTDTTDEEYKTSAKIIYDSFKNEKMNMDEILIRRSEVRGNKELTEAIDISERAVNSYNKVIDVAIEYENSKTEENLKTFKSSMKEFQKVVKEYSK